MIGLAGSGLSCTVTSNVCAPGAIGTVLMSIDTLPEAMSDCELQQQHDFSRLRCHSGSLRGWCALMPAEAGRWHMLQENATYTRADSIY